MMKRTSSSAIAFLFFATQILSAPEEVVFKVEAKSVTSATTKAEALANTEIRDRAFMGLTTRRDGQECWRRFIANRDLAIRVRGSSLKRIAHSGNFYTYQFTFDPEAIELKNVTSSEFDSYCEMQIAEGSANLNPMDPARDILPNTEDLSVNTGIKAEIVFAEENAISSKPGMPSSVTSEDLEIDY